MTDDKRQLLRHFLASIAYRTQKALRDAPPSFADFRAVENVRTPHELIWHMTGVIGYASHLFRGEKFEPPRMPAFDDEVERFHATLGELDALIVDADFPAGMTPETLLQGPLSDAMTHAGQIAMLRRLEGKPVPPENFLFADVSHENLGRQQPLPKAPKVGWRPDQQPQPPGRRDGNEDS